LRPSGVLNSSLVFINYYRERASPTVHPQVVPVPFPVIVVVKAFVIFILYTVYYQIIINVNE